jgi:hypothetical protein
VKEKLRKTSKKKRKNRMTITKTTKRAHLKFSLNELLLKKTMRKTTTMRIKR